MLSNAKFKSITSLLCLLLTLLSLFCIGNAAVPAESDSEGVGSDEHVHEYIANVIEPTCTQRGYTHYACECGACYNADDVQALGHTEAWRMDDAIVDTIYKYRYCVTCHEVFETVEIPLQQESGCLGGIGMYISYVMNVLLPAALVSIGKALLS